MTTGIVTRGGTLRMDPRRPTEETLASIREWDTLRIKTSLGVEFRHSTKVEVRKPRAMPGPLYRWLMRTVVVTVKNDERKTPR